MEDEDLHEKKGLKSEETSIHFPKLHLGIGHWALGVGRAHLYSYQHQKCLHSAYCVQHNNNKVMPPPCWRDHLMFDVDLKHTTSHSYGDV